MYYNRYVVPCTRVRAYPQQYTESLVLHPSGYPAARRQRCRHALRTSPGTFVQYARQHCPFVPSVLRAWVLCAIVRLYADARCFIWTRMIRLHGASSRIGSHPAWSATARWLRMNGCDSRVTCMCGVFIDESYRKIIPKIIYRRETVWYWDWPFFPRMTVAQTGVHVACPARRSRRGHPRNRLDFFDFGNAPDRPQVDGEGSRGAGPRAILRRPCRATPKSAGRTRRENTPPVEKNAVLLCYIPEQRVHFRPLISSASVFA